MHTQTNPGTTLCPPRTKHLPIQISRRIHTPTNLQTNQPTYLPNSPSSKHATYQPTKKGTDMSPLRFRASFTHLHAPPCIHQLYAHPSIHLSFDKSVCLPVCLSVCLPVSVYVCLFIYLSLCVSMCTRTHREAWLGRAVSSHIKCLQNCFAKVNSHANSSTYSLYQ